MTDRRADRADERRGRSRRRFPRSVYARGDEPDPRFSLANERTFLSWIRTSLALFAAGIALEALNLPIHPGLRFGAALLFIALGILAACQSWAGWHRAEVAMREGRHLPGPALGSVLTVGIALGAAAVIIALLL